MAEQSIINPAPFINTPIFIPEYWGQTELYTLQQINSDLSVIGQIKMVARTTLPSINWMWCDGTILDKNLYPDLYDLITYTYGGAGNSFALPDFTSKRSSIGAQTTNALTIPIDGNNLTTNSINNIIPSVNTMASHNHNYTLSLTGGNFNVVSNITQNYTNNGDSALWMNSDPLTIVAVEPTSGSGEMIISNNGGSSEYLPPFFVCNYIIRVN